MFVEDERMITFGSALPDVIVSFENAKNRYKYPVFHFKQKMSKDFFLCQNFFQSAVSDARRGKMDCVKAAFL